MLTRRRHSFFGVLVDVEMSRVIKMKGELSRRRPLEYSGGFRDAPGRSIPVLPPGFSCIMPAAVPTFLYRKVVTPGQEGEVRPEGRPVMHTFPPLGGHQP